MSRNLTSMSEIVPAMMLKIRVKVPSPPFDMVWNWASLWERCQAEPALYRTSNFYIHLVRKPASLVRSAASLVRNIASDGSECCQWWVCQGCQVEPALYRTTNIYSYLVRHTEGLVWNSSSLEYGQCGPENLLHHKRKFCSVFYLFLPDLILWAEGKFTKNRTPESWNATEKVKISH